MARPPRFQHQLSIKGLILRGPVSGGSTGAEFPDFLWKPNDPRYDWYKRGRDTAFAKAEDQVANILKDSLRQYHATNVSPYGRSIRAIRTKILPAGKSDTSPLGRKVWIGYQPTAAQNMDTPTDVGVKNYMLSVIYGIPKGSIHPPFMPDGSPRGPWAKTRSAVGAIYGSKDFAGFPGGRLGHWAMMKGMLPTAKFITKQQQRPRGARSLAMQKGGVRVYDDEYEKGLKSGIRRKPGRTASSSTSYQEYIPYDPFEGSKTTGKWKKKKVNVHWKASMFTGKYSMYEGKLVSNRSIAKKWIPKKGFKRGIPVLPKGAVPLARFGGAAEQKKLKSMGDSNIGDKTWENMAKFIAWSLEKKGREGKPVLQNWINEYIVSGKLNEEITLMYWDSIKNWNTYAMNKWKKDVTSKTGEPYTKKLVPGEAAFSQMLTGKYSRRGGSA